MSIENELNVLTEWRKRNQDEPIEVLLLVSKRIESIEKCILSLETERRVYSAKVGDIWICLKDLYHFAIPIDNYGQSNKGESRATLIFKKGEPYAIVGAYRQDIDQIVLNSETSPYYALGFDERRNADYLNHFRKAE